MTERDRLAAVGIASLRADDDDDVIIDDDDVFSDSGVPVSFPDAPGANGAAAASTRGGGGGGKRPRVKSADGSVIEMNYERGNGGDSFRVGVNGGHRDTESLDFLVREMKSKVKVSRSIWAHLPQTVCNDERMSDASVDGGVHGEGGGCWNGKERGPYHSPVVEESGLKAALKNPEFPSDAAYNEASLKPHTVIQEQLVALKSMTQRLKDAYNGMDVKWPEKEPEIGGRGGFSFEGSGSGDDGVDDDDEDGEWEGGSGSGDSTIDSSHPTDFFPPGRPAGNGGGRNGQTDRGRDSPAFPAKPQAGGQDGTGVRKPTTTKCKGKMVGKYCVMEGASTGNGARGTRPASLSALFVALLVAATAWHHAS